MEPDAMNDLCPRCGSPRLDLTSAGPCPRCSEQEGSDSPPVELIDSIATRFSTSVFESLARSIGPGTMPHVHLPDSLEGEDASPVVQPSSAEMPGPSERPSKIQLLGEIARGGMGAVLKGRDPDLGRDLAVKVLLDSHRQNPDLIRRFVEEAQIGGQLQHPGLVPVYELGTFGDSRPYFTMKLVKGRTLSALLSERAEPVDDRPRFLERFQKVAEALAYAHARGVIHRDIKPSNIMVGSFGEVQVMDWGLAKVLPKGGASDDANAGRDTSAHDTVIATARSEDDSDHSRAGSVLGTPSYMAPEQARGEVDEVDRRADVFALGSILCEILTGKPAFTGRRAEEIIRKAARGDLADAFARLKASEADVDAELVALAVDCLAPEPEDRPLDAQVVADRLQAHRNSIDRRLREAELAQAAEHARAEEAKRTALVEAARAEAAEARTRAERQARRLQLGLAASLFGLMVLGAGGYAWNHRQRANRIARTVKEVDQALADAARLRGEARSEPLGEFVKWAEAHDAARRAQTALEQGEADGSYSVRVEGLLHEIERERAVAVERARGLKVDQELMEALGSIRGNRADHEDFQKADADYTAAFLKAGLDLDKAGRDEAGHWLALRFDLVELAGFLDDWAYIRRRANRAEADWRRLVDAAIVADPDPWRKNLRARVATRDASAIAEFRRLADDDKALEIQPAASLVLLALQLKLNANDRERAARILRRAVAIHPDDYWSHFELAMVFGLDHGMTNQMFPQPEESARHLTAAVAIRPRTLTAYQQLSSALQELKRPDEAIAITRAALRFAPTSARLHNSLGMALKEQGQYDEAIVELRRAIQLDPQSEPAHHNLGNTLKAMGRLDEAADALRTASQLDPTEDNAANDLGLVLESQGKLAEAEAAYREAIRANPGQWYAHDNLGLILSGRGDLEEAVAAHRRAILVNPGRDRSHNGLGWALLKLGKIEEAGAEFREAIRLNPRNELAHDNLGDVLYNLGRLEESIAEHREALRLDPKHTWAHHGLALALGKLHRFDEAMVEYREAVRVNPQNGAAHNNMGLILAMQGKNDEALTEYREAIRINPKNDGAFESLGDLLRQMLRPDEAAAAYRGAIAANPRNDQAHTGLGHALWDLGQIDQAMAEYREAIRINPANDYAHANLGNLLARRGLYDQAEFEQREAIRINPANADAHGNLGVALRRKGDYAQSLVEFRRGHELGIKQAGWTNPSAEWVAQAETLVALGDRVPALLEGREKPKNSAEGLALGQLCYDLERHEAATRFWGDALALDPKLVEDRQAGHRYNAACAAALAGTGPCKDDPPPDEPRRAVLRKQALDWLEAELATWARVQESGTAKDRSALVSNLQHWKEDTDLAGVRDPQAIETLPEAERTPWRTLWERVDSLRKKAESSRP